MKIRHLILMIIACIAMIVSCVKIDYMADNRIPTNPKGEYAILFSQPAPMTKAQITSVSGTGYDSFSLFSWNSVNDTIMNPYTVIADGVNSYQYEDVTGQEIQYFRRGTDWYDFLGVIPTTHNMSLKDGSVKVEGVKSFIIDDKRVEMAVNLTDTLYWGAGLTEESPEEFLSTYKRISKSDYNNVVELPFKHENALIFLGFSSDKTDTKIIDYVPGVPGTSVPGTLISKKAKMFDEMASGQLVSYALVPLQGDQNGYYAGFKGNYFNLNPYHGAYNYVSKERLAELMPLVNAQFIYTDENCAYVDKWEYGVNKQYKIFLKFADGVNVDEFAAGNDAFWVNLTDEEKSRLQNHHDSGCRIIRIEKLPDGNYFAWGESYGTYINYSGRDLKIMDGGTIGTAPIPAIEGVRMFSADSLGVNNVPIDTLYCVHIPHTETADATIDANGTVLSNRVTTDNVIQYSLPETTTLSETPLWSPSTFYALPGDTDFNFIVVKLSYIYNGTYTYDVRVPIHLPDGGLQAGKYYKYELYITSLGNGTADPDEARDEKDEIIIEDNPIIQVRLVETGYTQGDERRFTI